MSNVQNELDALEAQLDELFDEFNTTTFGEISTAKTSQPTATLSTKADAFDFVSLEQNLVHQNKALMESRDKLLVLHKHIVATVKKIDRRLNVNKSALQAVRADLK
jgi:hypothetical protein